MVWGYVLWPDRGTASFSLSLSLIFSLDRRHGVNKQAKLCEIYSAQLRWLPVRRSEIFLYRQAKHFPFYTSAAL